MAKDGMRSSVTSSKTIRSYKSGGCAKMAAGGVAKIRHGQATPAGKPKMPPRMAKRGK